MIERLPYELHEDIIGTREGLVFSDILAYRKNTVTNTLVSTVTLTFVRWAFPELIGIPNNGHDATIPWPDAAERLRYREGEPWVYLAEGIPPKVIIGSEEDRRLLSGWVIGLNRIAAILCDDAEAFRVLHWCVENLGDSPELLTTNQTEGS